jgi:hypothetical protein
VRSAAGVVRNPAGVILPAGHHLVSLVWVSVAYDNRLSDPLEDIRRIAL